MIRKSGWFLFLFCFALGVQALAGGDKSIAGIQFSIPGSWKEVPPSSQMRAFQFEIPNEGGEAGELAVFYFGPSGGGGVEANLERWKQQFAKLTDEKIEKQTVDGLSVTETFLQGSYQQTSGPMMVAAGAPRENFGVLGGIVEAPDGAVFLKMTGPRELLASVKPDFDSLIGSIKKQPSE